tara:strand:+ start:1779 stop:2039 length:261 start_codon:yes stop_codon:yes gene_type:complete
MQMDSNKKTETLPKTFYVTYYAKKHKAIITRKGQWHKPNTDTVGKYFVDKNNQPNFIYWDLDAEPNKNGNQWRHATGMITVKVANA